MKIFRAVLPNDRPPCKQPNPHIITLMNNHTQAILNDTNKLVEDTRVLLRATSDVAEETVVAARNRLSAVLDSGRESYDQLRVKALESAKAADHAMRDHPYESVGIAFGVGVCLGVLMATARR